MLDRCDGQSLDPAPEQLECGINLPPEWSDYFEAPAWTSIPHDDRRNYPRRHMRGRALMTHKDRRYIVYTKDLSRSSLGFLHAEQLFPCEQVGLEFPNNVVLRLEVTRCRRVGAGCFECGAVILGSTSGASATCDA